MELKEVSLLRFNNPIMRAYKRNMIRTYLYKHTDTSSREHLRNMAFQAPDYVLFFSSVVITLGIGIYFIIGRRHVDHAANVISHSTRLPILAVVCSQIVTFLSPFGILAIPAEVYVYGFSLAFQIIGTALAFLFHAYVVIPLLYPLNLKSIYQYFQLRYGNARIRYLALILNIIYSLIYSGVVLFSTSLALKEAFGMPLWTMCAIIAITTGLYTALGGFVAVIWTDVFQTFIMFAGTCSILIKSFMDSGGMQSVLKHNKERLNCADFRLDPTVRYGVWNCIIGGFCSYLPIIISQQTFQRFNSLATKKKAQIMTLICIPVYSLWNLLLSATGLTMFSYYSEKGCDPLSAGKISSVNQIVPYNVLELFQHLPGMSGLFMASLLCASLSTLSSIFNSLGVVVQEDIILERFKQMSERVEVISSTITVLLSSILCFIIAVLFSYISGTIFQIALTFKGSINGPVVGMFLLSMFWRKTKVYGVAVGVLFGFGIGGWMAFGQTFSGTLPKQAFLALGPTTNCSVNISSHYTSATQRNQAFEDIRTANGLDKLYSVTYILLPFLAIVTTVFVGLIVSLASRSDDDGNVDDRCIVSGHTMLWLNKLNRRCFRKKQHVLQITGGPEAEERPTGTSDDKL